VRYAIRAFSTISDIVVSSWAARILTAFTMAGSSLIDVVFRLMFPFGCFTIEIIYHIKVLKSHKILDNCLDKKY